MFKKQSAQTKTDDTRIDDFSFVSMADIYADTACQSLRPLRVTKKLEEYYSEYNACGGRVKYAWGQRVDEQVEKTREAILHLLRLSPKEYVASFTLNTTYGINLLLSQLPAKKWSKIVTSEIEHNSVFLPTIAAAKRLGISRIVLERENDGTLLYKKADIEKAIVVVNAVSNIDGRQLKNIKQLVTDAHNAGSIVIVDAAQAMAHSYDILQGIPADAICFSGHKMYAPSVGVIVASKQLLALLTPEFVGGGMVYEVKQDSFSLLPEPDLASRLEPGLQAFGEIIALGEAIKWLQSVKPFGMTPKAYLQLHAEELYAGLQTIPSIHMLNTEARSVISFYSDEHDAHRLAIFLSGAGIMTRSGTFCCHYYLLEKKKSPPLVRLSLGLHTTKKDIDTIVDTLQRLHVKGK